LTQVATPADPQWAAPLRVTLYGDRTAPDPLSRPYVAVIFKEGSDAGPSLPGLAGPRVQPGFKRTSVQGRLAAYGHLAAADWIVWNTPPTSQETDQAAVLSSGTSRDETTRAAAGAHVNSSRAVIASAALPPGFTPLATGVIGTFGQLVPQAYEVRYDSTPGYVDVLTVNADAATETLLRLLTVGASPATINGHPGWRGRPLFADSASDSLTRYIWRQGTALAVVEVQPDNAIAVPQVLRSLKPRSPAAVANLRPESP
jgi:hypothetical protein